MIATIRLSCICLFVLIVSDPALSDRLNQQPSVGKQCEIEGLLSHQAVLARWRYIYNFSRKIKKETKNKQIEDSVDPLMNRARMICSTNLSSCIFQQHYAGYAIPTYQSNNQRVPHLAPPLAKTSKRSLEFNYIEHLNDFDTCSFGYTPKLSIIKGVPVIRGKGNYISILNYILDNWNELGFRVAY